MPVSRPRPSVRATRRTTLAAASLIGLAGCRWGPAEEDPDPNDGSPPGPDGDARTVDAAVAAIRGALALVVMVQAEFVGLSTALGPLADSHRAHLRLLDAPPVADRGGAIPQDSKTALRRVHTREALLQRQLAAFALEAESGQLAQALASMSASIAQHLAALPRLGKGPA